MGGISEKLDSDFRSTCRVIFGQEIGPLEEFGPYLSEMMFPFTSAKSCVSQKGVMLSGPHYPPSARFISQGEESAVKFAPLSINDIKDADSLFAAAQERAAYCGNKLFGTNVGVFEADNCADCVEVYRSHDIYRCKHAAFCSVGRFANSLYGVNAFWKANTSMRCMHCFFLGAQRCFETYYASGISDSYYTYNCSGCSNCMFSFNLRSKSFCIGNLQLPKERYLPLRQKLVSEMAEKLRRDKRLFSIADLVGKVDDGPGSIAWGESSAPPSSQKAFESACTVLLGQKHSLEKSKKWLLSRAIPREKIRGAFGTTTYRVFSPIGKRLPPIRCATLPEALAHSSRSIQVAEGESPSLEKIASLAGEMALFTQEFEDGQNEGCSETVTRVSSSNVHALWWAMGSKHSACSSIVTESEYVFGGYIRALNCGFCINGFNVTQCRNCFECDSCYLCRNCYFCHNCENVEEGILCFNLKGARYAVLNQQVGREEYARIKKMLLDCMNRELWETGGLSQGIFTLSRPRAPRANPRA